MSVIVKGMEMPENCIDCFAETYNECMATGKMVNSIGRPDWCPLVEVPRHGRLIDADALTKTISEHVYPVTDYFNSRDYGMFWTGGIEKAINEQPTIIEAEE